MTCSMSIMRCSRLRKETVRNSYAGRLSVPVKAEPHIRCRNLDLMFRTVCFGQCQMNSEPDLYSLPRDGQTASSESSKNKREEITTDPAWKIQSDRRLTVRSSHNYCI